MTDEASVTLQETEECTVPFYLQDPGNPETTYLIEVLLEECRRATGGAASFAWATSRGVNLLLENEHFVHFLRHHTFDLVVGLDAVTDEKALKSISRVQAELRNLQVSIFLNAYNGSLFHPKVCWFRGRTDGALVTGSGNLTEGGLSRNWEAFTVTPLNRTELSAIEAQWNMWKASYRDDLRSPTDEAVIARAKLNAAGASTRPVLPLPDVQRVDPRRSIAKRLPGNKLVGVHVPMPGRSTGRPVPSGTPPKPTAPVVPPTDDVLIAEIPRGSTRWNQANFDLDTYENFFGAKVGTTRYMFFRHVNSDGTLGDTETRPSVAVKSSNWRFELAAAAGRKYPAKGRPIAVFQREASRNFLYLLLMPNEPGYGVIEKILTAHWKGRAGRMGRVRLPISTLERDWPDSPFWKVEPVEA
jgi:hypothetical protein